MDEQMKQDALCWHVFQQLVAEVQQESLTTLMEGIENRVKGSRHEKPKKAHLQVIKGGTN